MERLTWTLLGIHVGAIVIPVGGAIAGALVLKPFLSPGRDDLRFLYDSCWYLAFFIPLGELVTLFSMPGFALRPFARQRMRNRRGQPYFCHACGYDLRRTNADRCPECGWVPALDRKPERERWKVARGRRIARKAVKGGVILCVCAGLLAVVWWRYW